MYMYNIEHLAFVLWQHTCMSSILKGVNDQIELHILQ